MKLKLPRFTIQVTAAYEREVLRKPINRVKFFIGTGFTLFVIFFILGVRPVAINSAENTKLLIELKEIKKNMEIKDEQLTTGLAILIENKKNIEYMQVLLPDETNVQNYLESFVVTAAKNGFFVKRFLQSPSKDNYAIPIEIEVVGKLNNLPELISAIEKTPRITNINQITLNSIGDEPNYVIKLRMEIYSIK